MARRASYAFGYKALLADRLRELGPDESLTFPIAEDLVIETITPLESGNGIGSQPSAHLIEVSMKMTMLRPS